VNSFARTELRTKLKTEGKGKVKVNMDLLSPCREHTSKALSYGTRSQGISQFTCTPHVHPLTEWTIPAFSFPAEAGPHLPTPEGWKAELAWVTDYIPR